MTYNIFQSSISQLNSGTVKGKLFDSFGCDLTFDEGKMSASPRGILTTDSISNMALPIGFKYFDGHWFTVAGRMMMNDGTALGTFSQDSSTGAPTTTLNSSYSDIAVFGSALLVSATDQLYSKASNSGIGNGAYTSRRTFGSGESPSHMIETYGSRAYWVDTVSQIFSFDSAYTPAVTTNTSYTFKIPDGQDIMCMRKHANGLYIGTSDRNGGDAYVYDWNGVTADTWRNRYQISAQSVNAMHVDSRGTLFIMNSNAELMQFTGAGFSVVARLPIKRSLLYKATFPILNNRFIHPNGMASIDGRISLLINSRLNSTTAVTHQANIASGIWEYVPSSSGMGTLYHKVPLTYKTYSGPITDYGQICLDSVGGLANVSDLYTSGDSSKGNFLAGATYYSGSSTSSGIGTGIWSDDYFDAMEKACYFSTVQIRAQHALDAWDRIVTQYVPTPGFTLVAKYRTSVGAAVDFDITWISQRSFTCSEAVSNGDEITIIQGKGSGRVAHAASVTGTGTYTVTLDETVQLASGTARARKQNWKKLNHAEYGSKRFLESPISASATMIELKIAMVATGEATVDEIILDNKKNQ